MTIMDLALESVTTRAPSRAAQYVRMSTEHLSTSSIRQRTSSKLSASILMVKSWSHTYARSTIISRPVGNAEAILADLESQAEAISRLLAENSGSDIEQSAVAKEKFLQWRALFEKRRKALLKSSFSLMLRNAARVAFAQTESDVLLRLPV